MFSRDDELLSPGLLSYFLFRDPRNFQPDIDTDKTFYVARGDINKSKFCAFLDDCNVIAQLIIYKQIRFSV